MQPVNAVSAAFAAFHQRVIEEPALFSRLQSASDQDALAELAVRCAAERGLQFGVEEVHAALGLARRAWLERNIP